MKQIELLLQNKGVNKSVIFPCSEAEYQATCEELELKDNYAFVRDVVEPKALSLKKDTFVNLDEINYFCLSPHFFVPSDRVITSQNA